MNVETEKISLRQVVDRQEDIFVVEDSIIIPDIKPDILSVIATSPNLYVYRKDLNNGKIKIDGGVQLDTIYLSDEQESKTRALHNTIDFTRNLDFDNRASDDCSFLCNLCVKSVEPKILNGRKISLKVTIGYEVMIYSNVETKFIRSLGEENQYQKISETMNISAFKNHGESVCSAREKITVSEGLNDILQYRAYLKNKEEKVSYNKILSKADCIVDVLYLTMDEQLRNEEVKIPVTGFVDMPGITDNEIIKTDYEVRNIEIKADSAESNVISIDIEFTVNCETFENRSIDLIQDLYSPDEEITLRQEHVALEKNRRSVFECYDVTQNINIPDAQDGSVYVSNISINNLSRKAEKNAIAFGGNAVVECIYKSNTTGRIESKSENVEFSRSVSIDGVKEETIINTNVDAYFSGVRAVADGNFEVSITINCNLDLVDKVSVNLINDIKVEENVPESKLSSLTIYFTKDGDTLWKIAKRYKTTIDEIAEINNLEDIDNLASGVQLFIPRHVSCKT